MFYCTTTVNMKTVVRHLCQFYYFLFNLFVFFIWVLYLLVYQIVTAQNLAQSCVSQCLRSSVEKFCFRIITISLCMVSWILVSMTLNSVMILNVYSHSVPLYSHKWGQQFVQDHQFLPGVDVHNSVEGGQQKVDTSRQGGGEVKICQNLWTSFLDDPISDCRWDRTEIPTTERTFWRPSKRMGLVRILSDQTGSQNCNMTASKPEIPISQLEVR